MPRYSEESIRRVAEANDIVEVIATYLPLKRAGSAFKGLCPFHKEKTPSFTVNPARQSYHCFGCQAGGGVIRFVMDYERISFTDALVKLADRAGIRLIEETGGGNTNREERPRLLELHRLATSFFQKQLFKSPAAAAARSYLKSRGFDEKVAESWSLGYAPAAPDAFAQHATKAGFHPAELVKAGLCFENERGRGLTDRFRDRVMIPICNDYGDVVAFSGRVLDPGASPAKYINSPETPLFSKGRLLFGLHKTKRALMQAGEAIICEGQFDLISLYEAGIQNVLAPQGTAFTPHQATLLKRFVPRVVLCFDSDSAGQKAADRSLPALLAREISVRILLLPTGEDPDSLVRREGGEAFRLRVEQAADVFTHKITQARSSGALATPVGLAALTKELAGLLRLLPDPILQDALRNQIAAALQVDPGHVLSLMRQSKPAIVEAEEAPEPTAAEDAAPLELPEGCLFLCKAALCSAEVCQWLAVQQSPSIRDLGPDFSLLQKIVQFGCSADPASPALLALCSPAEQSTLALLNTRQPPRDLLPATTSTWNGLVAHHLRHLIQKTKNQLLDRSLTPQKIVEIQKELLDLHRRLQNFAGLPLADPTE